MRVFFSNHLWPTGRQLMFIARCHHQIIFHSIQRFSNLPQSLVFSRASQPLSSARTAAVSRFWESEVALAVISHSTFKKTNTLWTFHWNWFCYVYASIHLNMTTSKPTSWINYSLPIISSLALWFGEMNWQKLKPFCKRSEWKNECWKHLDTFWENIWRLTLPHVTPDGDLRDFTASSC